MDPGDPWAAYARAQQSADRYDATVKTWAADEAAAEALERIACGATVSVPEHANLLTNRAAKFRRRRRIESRHRAELFPSQPGLESQILARSELARCGSASAVANWSLLVTIAMGSSYEEAASTMGIPTATAKSRVRRARAQLMAQPAVRS